MTNTDPWGCKFMHPEIIFMTKTHPKREVPSRATVAYRYKDGGIDYNLTVLSPGDQWNRRIGRMMAAGRLDKFPVSLDFNHKIELHENASDEDRSNAVRQMKDNMLDAIFKDAIKHSERRALRHLSKYRYIEEGIVEKEE